VNTVQLIGRLTRDPELRMSQTSDPVCSMRLAVDRMGENGTTGYIDVVVFGRPGQACAEHLSRGWLVGVSGRLRHREWTAGDGGHRSGLSVVGSVEFLAAPRSPELAPDEPLAAA
jgi:single-strand DNA-binding protein